MDGVTALSVAPGVSLLRASCTERLKYEVEYGLKRGSTDNAYLVSVGLFAMPAYTPDYLATSVRYVRLL